MVYEICAIEDRLSIRSTLHLAVNDVRKENENLWEDLKNHYPELKADVEDLCTRIEQFNESVRRLELRVRKYVEEIVNKLDMKTTYT